MQHQPWATVVVYYYCCCRSAGSGIAAGAEGEIAGRSQHPWSDLSGGGQWPPVRPWRWLLDGIWVSQGRGQVTISGFLRVLLVPLLTFDGVPDCFAMLNHWEWYGVINMYRYITIYQFLYIKCTIYYINQYYVIMLISYNTIYPINISWYFYVSNVIYPIFSIISTNTIYT